MMMYKMLSLGCWLLVHKQGSLKAQRVLRSFLIVHAGTAAVPLQIGRQTPPAVEHLMAQV